MLKYVFICKNMNFRGLVMIIKHHNPNPNPNPNLITNVTNHMYDAGSSNRCFDY